MLCRNIWGHQRSHYTGCAKRYLNQFGAKVWSGCGPLAVLLPPWHRGLAVCRGLHFPTALLGNTATLGPVPSSPATQATCCPSLPGCRVRHHLPAEAEPTHVHRYHARAAAQLSLTIKPLCLNRLFCINGLLLHTHWDKGNKAKAQITETTVRLLVRNCWWGNKSFHSKLSAALCSPVPTLRRGCLSLLSPTCYLDISSAVSRTRGFIFLHPEDTGHSGYWQKR